MKRGILDPRTKIILLIALGFFVTGGFGEGLYFTIVKYTLIIMPLLILISVGRWKKSLIFITIYAACFVLGEYILDYLDGTLKFLIGGCISMYMTIIPTIVMGSLIISTTTVSQFNAAMKRMHVSEKITIPMSVMFRFFPTVFEEASAVNSAMKMRGIRLGGNKLSDMFEYRIVPIMTCSVTIGEELSQASLSRGLCGKAKRTNICKIGFGLLDVVVILMCILTFVMYFLQSMNVL